MYIVTYNGKKLKVDDSNLEVDEKDFFPFQQTVGLYTDDTILKPIWLVIGQKRDSFAPARKSDNLEFVCEKVYKHEPSKEDLLWFMSANGLSRYDIVTIEQGYTLDMIDD